MIQLQNLKIAVTSVLVLGLTVAAIGASSPAYAASNSTCKAPQVATTTAAKTGKATIKRPTSCGGVEVEVACKNGNTFVGKDVHYEGQVSAHTCHSGLCRGNSSVIYRWWNGRKGWINSGPIVLCPKPI